MVSTVLLTLSSRRLRSMGGVLELADDAGDEHLFAGDGPAEAACFLDLGLGGGGGGGQLFVEQRRSFSGA